MTTANLSIEEVAENQDDKEITVNDAITALEDAITEYTAFDLSAGNVSLTAGANLLAYKRNIALKTTGNAVSRDLTLPPVKRAVMVWNAGSATLNVKVGSTTVTVAAGALAWLYVDGTTNGLLSIGVAGGGAVSVDADDVAFDDTGLSITALNVQEALEELDAALGTVGDVTLTGTQTLTNKTLTAPVINSPTGIVKGDVGLGNVDNTSNATERAASATLTNKTINGANNTLTVRLASDVTGTLADANLSSLHQSLINGAVGIYKTGKPDAGEILWEGAVTFALRFPSSLTGSYAKSNTANATSSSVYTLYKNGVSFATITFTSGGSSGSVTAASNTDFAAGDILKVSAPASQDTTLSGVNLTLAFTRL